MTLHVFLILLLICSVFTALTVEGIKKLLTDGESRKANVMAAIVSVVLALIAGFGYVAFFEVIINAQYIFTIIALCFLSWLCAMVGYDKVMQAIGQIVNSNVDKLDK